MKTLVFVRAISYASLDTTSTEFNYKINLEFASLRNSLPLNHLTIREEPMEKTYKGYSKNENSTHNLHIESEFGSVKLNPSNL